MWFERREKEQKYELKEASASKLKPGSIRFNKAFSLPLVYGEETPFRPVREHPPCQPYAAGWETEVEGQCRAWQPGRPSAPQHLNTDISCYKAGATLAHPILEQKLDW